jgi:hypothetical protein
MKPWFRNAWKSTALICGLLLVLFFVALLSAPLWQQRWIQPRPYAEIVPSLPFMNKSEVKPGDAFDLLQRAQQAAEPETKLASPDIKKEFARLNETTYRPDAFPLLEQALQQNVKAMDLLRQTAVAPNPRIPTPVSINEKIDYATATLSLSRLFCYSAEKKAASGDYPGAFNEINTILQNGCILSNGGTIIHRFIACTTSSLAYTTIYKITVTHKIPASLLKNEASWLASYESQLPPLSENFKQDFISFGQIFEKGISQLAPTKTAWFSHPSHMGVKSFIFQICGSNTQDNILADLNSMQQAILEQLTQPYRHDNTIAFEKNCFPHIKACSPS